jgi:restriction system protein
MDKNEVNTAFEILLEEIELVANQLNDAGGDAFRDRDYERAKGAVQDATRLAEFREKVKQLQKEWTALFTTSRRAQLKIARRKRSQRLNRSLRTSEDAFSKPILEALVELGGSAPINDVLERVEKKMSSILNEYDRQRLPSGRRSVRWKNTAQWCRSGLVRGGLMKADSPHGIWEISEDGRRWMKNEAQT